MWHSGQVAMTRNPDRSWWHCHTSLKILSAAAHGSMDKRSLHLENGVSSKLQTIIINLFVFINMHKFWVYIQHGISIWVIQKTLSKQKIGKEKGNSYRKNEKISRWKVHISTRKLNRNVLMITCLSQSEKSKFMWTHEKKSAMWQFWKSTQGRGWGKIEWKSFEGNARAVSRGQNKLIGKFKMGMMCLSTPTFPIGIKRELVRFCCCFVHLDLAL